MTEFELRITFTSESESDLNDGYENVLGGIEFLVDGTDIVSPHSTEEPSTIDYLCLSLRSLLRAIDDLRDGAVGVVSFYEFESYLALVPETTDSVRLGVDNDRPAMAIERAERGPRVERDELIKESLAAAQSYLNKINQANVEFRSTSCTDELEALVARIESPR